MIMTPVTLAVLLLGACTAPSYASSAASIESADLGVIITVPEGANLMVRSANEDGSFGQPQKVVTQEAFDTMVRGFLPRLLSRRQSSCGRFCGLIETVFVN